MELPSYQDWHRQFVAEIEQDETISSTELAGFLAILQGFAQAGRDLDKNASIVKQTLQKGELNFWGKRLPISEAEFAAIDFSDPKWAMYSRRAMAAMHGQSRVQPESLRFLSRDETSQVAQDFLSIIQNKVVAKEVHA